MKLNIVRLGLMDYAEALRIQEKLLTLRQEDKIDDTLLLVEHPAVLTLGRRGEYSHILTSRQLLEASGVSIYEVNRGGDVTYHGPGQIVGYPIMDLAKQDKDVKKFVWNIEEVFIRLLKQEYGITAQRDENKYTGVWIGNEKITAIGIAVKRWVTMHGFAFNVNTHLEDFGWIIPCGLTDRSITSVQKLLGQHMDFDELNDMVMKYFCQVFGVEPVIMGLDELYGIVEKE